MIKIKTEVTDKGVIETLVLDGSTPTFKVEDTINRGVVSVTTETLFLYVDNTLGDDTNSGLTSGAPLKTIVRAESLVPDCVKHEVVITVQPHGGSGYVWSTFRGRVFSGPDAQIFIYFPEISVVFDEGGVGLGGTTVEKFMTSGLTPGSWHGKTMEITEGPSAGDRKTVRDTLANQITCCADFTADPEGYGYRIIEPHSGNLILPPDDREKPLVQGIGMGSDFNIYPPGGVEAAYVPGVTIINAKIDLGSTSTQYFLLVADGRLNLIGCEIKSTGLLVSYQGSGQLMMGGQAWNTAQIPSTVTGVNVSGWVGWGVFFSGGHKMFWSNQVPHVIGYLVTEENYLVNSGQHDITGHIQGMLKIDGGSGGADYSPPIVSFGKAQPFMQGVSAGPGMITADVDNVDWQAGAMVIGFGARLNLFDETVVTNIGLAPVLMARRWGQLHIILQLEIRGTNGGDGLRVLQGGKILMYPAAEHATLGFSGTVVGQLFSIGPRAINATMADDFNNWGDFVSGARAFWDTALAVTTNVVTSSTIGAVVAVEAVSGSSTGAKLIQRSATPPSGSVRVEYNAQGFGILTFNGGEAITIADIYIQPEDDGTLITT